MSIIASLTEINKNPNGVFVAHEKLEREFPLHSHEKGQLSFVEGGIAYISIANKTYVVPARHFFWIPKGVAHKLRVGQQATVLHSFYFFDEQENEASFYRNLGIYPASELLIQMINYTERWSGKMVDPSAKNFEFLKAMKQILPEFEKLNLPILLPITEDERMNKIISFLTENMQDEITLKSLSSRFNVSERTMSRIFQDTLHMSFLQYLKSLRMVKAIELILKTNKSIGEIALCVGFQTLGAFSNNFHDFTKTRPLDMRKLKIKSDPTEESNPLNS